jgi:dTDP-4-amino-4,6-dideoxygalactose transaminase
LLPDAGRLLPYLQRIDSTRIYSNWGPLVSELTERLCHAFMAPAGGVVSASSGMAALMGAILATAGRANPQSKKLAVMPDFTFTATGLAAQLCGYEPLLASTATTSWALTPEALLARPDVLEQTALVVPVVPFGRNSIDLQAWQHFQDTTGIAVIIDAAASFESLHAHVVQPQRIPLVLSFHATKTFGTGEGGCVVTTDTELANRIGQCLNFGFAGSRNSAVASVNGKLSEYHAAVGLAELDGWEEKSRRYVEVATRYQRAFAQAGVSLPLWTAPQVSSNYVILQCASAAQSGLIVEGLSAAGVETRLWYGDGLSGNGAFADTRKLDLHGALALEPRTLLGLPTAVDFDSEQTGRVAHAVRQLLH